MVDEPRINDLLSSAAAYVADTRRFAAAAGRERFLADVGEQYRVEFPLQQALQRTLDLAAHLLASDDGQRPSTLAGLFAELARRAVVPEDLAGRLAAMARFRNLLVHQYADVDPARVWEIVQHDLDDVDRFLMLVASRLDRG